MSQKRSNPDSSPPPLPLFSWQGNLPQTEVQRQHWTVSEFTQKLRAQVEPSFQNVWIVGEMVNFKPAPSGHLYFSLKDEDATLACAFFSWSRSSLSKKIRPQNGLKILGHGKISVYPPRGGYQLVLDHLELLGTGALQQRYEELKLKLEKEGIFNPSLRRPLPSYPRKVAVITSPTGAAIEDFLKILGRRAPQIEVIIVPSLVQGDQAPAQLLQSLEIANRLPVCDLVILTRGGGSAEDLWCFNDEALVRAVRKSRLPVVSAIGHEIDFTLCDFAADLRAPTPSAAAEIISNSWLQASQRLDESHRRLLALVKKDLLHRRQMLAQWMARLKDPRQIIQEKIQRCDEYSIRIVQAMKRMILQHRQQLALRAGELHALSPLRVLQRGYAIVLQGQKVVRRVADLSQGQQVEIRMEDGQKPAQIL